MNSPLDPRSPIASQEARRGSSEALLPTLFAQVAERQAHRIAVEVPPGEGRPLRTTLTYGALLRAAQGVAGTLAEHVGADDRVALLIDRGGAELYAAQLGVLMAGAAYVPIDLAQPPERLRAILEDAAPRLALVVPRCAAQAAELTGGRMPLVNVAAAMSSTAKPPPLPPAPSPDALAYLIYTSGTTGRPKGVMIEHGAIANLVHSDVQRFQLNPEDRVAQGSSPIYDSSVEEIWLAFAAGATLVVLDGEVARSGPDLVPWLQRERITVLSPPPTLLRATGCREPWRELPELRLLYVGGEQLPPDVAEAWSRGRWMENGYGPTECTVTVVRGRIEPDGPITIGTPVRGHVAHLLDERLEPVPVGEAGELCVSGPGLARGYLGLPDLSEEAFPQHPKLGRIYRTGDLAVHRDGALHCLGRIDTQVKVRGHRIELEEVEAHLVSLAGVRAAAAFTQEIAGEAILSAWVLPSEPGVPLDPIALRAALAKRVPDAFLPTRIGICAELPTTAGGKLDRKALPPVRATTAKGAAATVRSTPSATPPATHPANQAAARLVTRVVSEVLELERLPLEADLFSELGCHSLAAARIVSQIRTEAPELAVTVRDLYELRTAAALITLLGRTAPPRREVTLPPRAEGGGHPLAVGLGQLAWISGALVLASLVARWLLDEGAPTAFDILSLPTLLWLSPLLGLALVLLRIPLAIGVAVLAKRLLIGRYRAGRQPAWGLFHLRHWIVQRFAGAIPWGLLAGTDLQLAALRVLGARVGSGVHIHRDVNLSQGGWDLLEIGEGAALGAEVGLRMIDVERGGFVLGPVRIGAHATVEVRGGLEAHSELGHGAQLGALSIVESGCSLAPHRRHEGVPAKDAGEALAAPRPTRGREWTPRRHTLALLAARSLLGLGLALPGLLATLLVIAGVDLDSAAVASWIAQPTDLGVVVAITGGLAVASLVLSLVVRAVLARWLAPPPGGAVPRRSALHLRIQMVSGLVSGANDWLSGTLMWPTWLRVAGARIGRGSEISTIVDAVPRWISVGSDSFFADGIYLGCPLVQGEVVHCEATRVGSETFFGNHVVVPAGSTLPDGILLGISTPSKDLPIRTGSSWFGHPAFELPQREIIAMPRDLTHEPTPLRYATRVLFEQARFLLPLGPVVAFTLWIALVAPGDWADLAVATAAVAALTLAVVILLKWILLGRVRPGEHGLWSFWCARWDYLYMVWGRWARPLLTTLELTPWLPLYLRAMGCRVGRRTLLGAGFAQVVDPDMIAIADGATVNGLFQAHSFEDRVLKIDRVQVGESATTRAGSVLLYGADIGRGAIVSAHSVVMKREHLLPDRLWRGCPTRDEGPLRKSSG